MPNLLPSKDLLEPLLNHYLQNKVGSSKSLLGKRLGFSYLDNEIVFLLSAVETRHALSLPTIFRNYACKRITSGRVRNYKVGKNDRE